MGDPGASAAVIGTATANRRLALGRRLEELRAVLALPEGTAARWEAAKKDLREGVAVLKATEQQLYAEHSDALERAGKAAPEVGAIEAELARMDAEAEEGGG